MVGTEERSSVLEDRTMKIKSEQHRENKLKKK